MNIHEYQAKILFDQFSVPSPRGMVADTSEEAAAAAVELGGDRVVVKSQIHAGGRGKGTFKNGFQGGGHLVASGEVAGIADRMIGEILVTKQTGIDGVQVKTIYVTTGAKIDREIYAAVLLDRQNSRVVLVIAVVVGGGAGAGPTLRAHRPERQGEIDNAQVPRGAKGRRAAGTAMEFKQ